MDENKKNLKNTINDILGEIYLSLSVPLDFISSQFTAMITLQTDEAILTNLKYATLNYSKTLFHSHTHT